ncbi:MAG: hypothetical protein WKG07_44655 [Hymenobacter sp.]
MATYAYGLLARRRYFQRWPLGRRYRRLLVVLVIWWLVNKMSGGEGGNA